MKLYYSKTSPYSRKALVCAMELGLKDEVSVEIVHPIRNTDIVSAANPLGKVPCLVREDGGLVVDSPAICAYLQRRASVNGGIDLSRSPYLDVDDIERIHALADGIMDVAYPYVMETLRPQEQQSPMWKDRWIQTLHRTLAYIENHESEKLHSRDLTMAHLALACALGYLDFRLNDLNWREGNTRLAQWYEQFSQRESLQTTIPND